MPSLKSLLLLTTLATTALSATCLGNQNSVYACFTVKWSDREEANIKVTVKDTDDDHHEVYGTYKKYLDGEGQDWEKVRNNKGYGSSVNNGKNGKTLYGGGKKITGVRVKACVDDFGSDTCTGDVFIPYKA